MNFRVAVFKFFCMVGESSSLFHMFLSATWFIDSLVKTVSKLLQIEIG